MHREIIVFAADQRKPQQPGDGTVQPHRIGGDTVERRWQGASLLPDRVEWDPLGCKKRAEIQQRMRRLIDFANRQRPGARHRVGIVGRQPTLPQQRGMVLFEQLTIMLQRASGVLDVGRRLLEGERQPAQGFGQRGCGHGIRIAGALRKKGHRLRGCQHLDPKRRGHAGPDRLARGNDHRSRALRRIVPHRRAVLGIVKDQKPAGFCSSHKRTAAATTACSWASRSASPNAAASPA
jgi:hypothetical protein